MKLNSYRRTAVKFFLLFCLGLSLAGCISKQDSAVHPAAAAPVKASRVPEQKAAASPPKEAEAKQTTRFLPTPPPLNLPLPPPPTLAPDESLQEGEPVMVNFDSMALPAFINEVYGNILKISFEIEQELLKQKDLVTLRTTEPQTLAQLDKLARKVLANYGVAADFQGDILRFSLSQQRGPAIGEPPLLVSGRALPETPASHRPIFQLVYLKAVRNTQVSNWLKTAFKGQKLEVFEDPERNAILLLGAHELVNQAAQAVAFLDQPTMRGRYSVRVEPVFLDAEELATLLVDVLNSQGYTASLKPPLASIIVMPVKAVNAVLIFAADQAVLDHVSKWAANLDQPGRDTAKTGFFYYNVRNTSASELAEVLGSILSDTTALPTAGATGASGKAGEKEATVKGAGSASQRLLVDEARNGLIFHGSAMEWQAIQSVIQKMDIPPRQVMIEVTLAEVTLTDQEEYGIEWLFKTNDIGFDVNFTDLKPLDGTVQTLGGLGVGSSGLLYTLNSAGETRAVLNALATKNRVAILSNPRIMVKSGVAASINVGTEVPIVTSQATSSELESEGTSSLLQEIQYRNTGVLLNVKPVVHSGNRVDLEIVQEVSEAGVNQTSDVSSPSIFTRRVSTELSLEDGGSVLLGGLISSSTNQGDSGIPFLKDIPLLGQLFRVNSNNDIKTELMILIVPYVISNNQDSAAITEEFRHQLQVLNAPNQ